MFKKIIPIFLIIGVLVFVFLNLPKTIAPVSLSQLTPSQNDKSTPVSVLLDVPFVSQAPTGNWADSRQQDGCEEASAYMAYLWATNTKKPASTSEQEQKIIEISDWEEKMYGSFHDTSAKDTAERILSGYFKYTNYEVKYDIKAEDIRLALSLGKIVIAPADGQAIGNPYFTGGGPERHFLLIKGYDLKSDEFITNDNGTKRGESYRYKTSVLMNSLRDYPTGDHVPIVGNRKVIVVVSK